MKMEFYKQFTLKISPFPLFNLYSVMTYRLKGYAGASQKIGVSEFEGGISNGYFVREDVYECGDVIAEKLISGRLKLRKILKDFKARLKTLMKIAMDVNSANVGEYSNYELSMAYTRYCNLHLQTFIPASIPFMCDFSLERMASEELQREFGFEKSVQLLTALSAPTGLSWELKEKVEFAEFAKKAKRKGIRSLRELKNSNLRKEFEKHIHEWRWLPYNYENEPLSERSFEKRFEENLKNGEKIEAGIEKGKGKIENERKKALKIAGKSKGVKMALLLGELAYFKEYRKGLMSKTLFSFEPVLREIARRIGVKLKEARYIWPDELPSALKNPEKWALVLKDRWKYSVYVQKGEKHRVYLGIEGKKFLKALEFEKPGRELRGTVACMGKATGNVKIIIKLEDMRKMKKGDILVSGMTTPDLVPAIKMAAAIVTDTGGMTSHAAIVSREFNIPCIIGTQHATQLLKDGDLVEVDATKGIVKKLKG